MAKTIEEANGYMRRDKVALENAGEILYEVRTSRLFTDSDTIEQYESKRKEIIRELGRIRAYIRDVVGD
mgnify:CR=1 FL=1